MVVNRNKKHVLVVEDDATTRAILKAQLEKLGHPVSEAENGKVAHEMLQAEHDFEIIVLDRQMPEMDGMELMKAMKRDRRMRSIPVIMQTGMLRIPGNYANGYGFPRRGSRRIGCWGFLLFNETG